MEKGIQFNAASPIYLLKVFLGLATIGSMIGLALWLPDSGLSSGQRCTAVVALVAMSIGLMPAIRWIYLQRDELERLQHQQACTASVAITASASALVGVLQSNQLLPNFNQFWTLGLLIAVWGVWLSLASRRYL